jgi:undecaprenyl-diphosphatase
MSVPRPGLRLVAILAALWLAMLLLGGPQAAADRGLAAAIRWPELVPAARLLTRLGDWPILLPLTAAGAAALFFAHSTRRRLLVEVQKFGLGRARPELSGRLVHVASLSFPSAHAAYSMMTWLAFALLLAPPPRRRIAVAAAVAAALAVGLTRLILQVHWPSDVIGGWAFGAGWTLLCLRLAGGTATRRRH